MKFLQNLFFLIFTFTAFNIIAQVGTFKNYNLHSGVTKRNNN